MQIGSKFFSITWEITAAIYSDTEWLSLIFTSRIENLTLNFWLMG